jgi:hypothetical protein
MILYFYHLLDLTKKVKSVSFKTIIEFVLPYPEHDLVYLYLGTFLAFEHIIKTKN